MLINPFTKLKHNIFESEEVAEGWKKGIVLTNFFGINIPGYGVIKNQAKLQVLKAAKVSGALNEIIWKNKYFDEEVKVRIYKSVLRPVLTYAAKKRAKARK